MSNGTGGMGILGWLIVGVILLGIAGIGPCSGTCASCSPVKVTVEKKP